MKAYTDLEQSKKLIELGIDVKTADMRFCFSHTLGGRITGHYPMIGREPSMGTTPCWSLAALLELIPPYLGEFKDGIDFGLSKSMNGKWYSAHYIQLNDDGISTFNKTVTGDTAIDAVFEMVVWLKENGKI